MARLPRRKGISGYFHLIMRGNNKQVLFECPEDYRFFIRRLGRFCREADVRIVCYCLMENHIHLLVNAANDALPEMMKRLGVSYSKYYNERYERVGHLFQDRYLSEPVENEAYLLTVFRYILNNPYKAGICPAAEYRWSSYKAFFKDSTPLDLDFFHERFPTAEAYREYISAPCEDECLDYIRPCRDDDWARGVIQKCFGVKSGTELQSWALERRSDALLRLKQEGLTVRQIARLTGISRYQIGAIADKAEIE